ncbi:hypothetical protein F3Y22_tig00117034pilonHSYRG00172 [Hibiscus syriacus]|uniref:Uncharacterized protein n=1 Tax=Hibiscus syriacus TaxID=106335 RepID=A0A6A2WZ20_HIBSY|nr:hypothetical protein F3Y22_tig00117034pilonHSYRG00172 [Hibiscus syriacus]
MSWVNWVRLERAGDSEPARPGEPERPVPRERMVTRPTEPGDAVNEEQGSVRRSPKWRRILSWNVCQASLMRDNAARSTPLILGRC